VEFQSPTFKRERLLGKIMSSGSAYQERRILSFPKGGTRRLQLCFGNKSIANLGVYESKARRKVCSLHFQEATITIKKMVLLRFDYFFVMIYREPQEAPYKTYIVVFWNWEFNSYKE